MAKWLSERRNGSFLISLPLLIYCIRLLIMLHPGAIIIYMFVAEENFSR
jgi:hypothetical protein